MVIASNGAALSLLKNEFPGNIFEELPDYGIKYKFKSMILNALSHFPKVKKAIIDEHLIAEDLTLKYYPEMIISDNRYGFWSGKVKSVLITHQLNILVPRWLKPIKKFAQPNFHGYFDGFDEIWVPDYEGEKSLSGNLSQPNKINKKVVFIGPISRYDKMECEPQLIYDHLGIVSGPEPSRTDFEKILLERFRNFEGKKLIICGIPNESFSRKIDDTNLIAHADEHTISKLISGAGLVHSRSGYSTIMDLVKLQKKAVFTPTPGQTEQEYLARRMSIIFPGMFEILI